MKWNTNTGGKVKELRILIEHKMGTKHGKEGKQKAKISLKDHCEATRDMEGILMDGIMKGC